MNMTDAAGRLGLSLRKVNYWANTGYIEIPESSSGRDRQVDQEAFEQLRVMSLLNEAGFTVATAARLARQVRSHEPEPIYPGGERSTFLPLTEHVTVTIKERA